MPALSLADDAFYAALRPLAESHALIGIDSLAAGSGGIDIGHFADHQRRRAYDPGAARDQRNGDGDDDIMHAGAEDRDDRQRHDDQREGHHHVEHALHQHIDQAAEIGAADAKDQTQGAADERRRQADDQRGAGTEDDPR